MDNSWDNWEPSPIEFMHGQLLDRFHEYRRSSDAGDIYVKISGTEFSEIIVSAKKATYEKYKKLALDKAVPKDNL